MAAVELSCHTLSQYRTSHSIVRCLSTAQHIAPYAIAIQRYRTTHITIRHRSTAQRTSLYAIAVPQIARNAHRQTAPYAMPVPDIAGKRVG
eukprot:1370220-Rhodomonas_salina.4